MRRDDLVFHKVEPPPVPVMALAAEPGPEPGPEPVDIVYTCRNCGAETEIVTEVREGTMVPEGTHLIDFVDNCNVCPPEVIPS
jgi:hypothetical protein